MAFINANVLSPLGWDQIETWRESKPEAWVTACLGSVNLHVHVTFCPVCTWEIGASLLGPRGVVLGGGGQGPGARRAPSQTGPGLQKPSLGAW